MLINKQKFDLIYSNFFCQLTSNFDKLIENIFKCLNSNGFFIATIPSNENIYQLVNSMYETDNILYGGMYQRVNPILDTNDIFKLLKVYNFDAPLINNNNFTIEYSVFNKLLDDVRYLNLPYAGKDKKNNFTFNGTIYHGYEGDTLASALIANGVHLVGRSFKYHRPRGFLGVGVEEPNAMVQLHDGNKSEPNIIATEVELVEGLKAKSQNCWPSVQFDIG